ncbi:MAG: DNA repair protein RadA [Thermoflexus sp.]|uniref:DNA repair protein RadA n=1 Tax=Thermoflexus sp. TaxID=1969742 RepID=UPI00331D47BB
MARPRTQYVCQKCGAVHPKWMGRCPDCGEWNTLVEVPTTPTLRAVGAPPGPAPQPVSLPAVEAADVGRWPLPLGEFARVLGGGVVPGSLVLVAGDPGIGKSTLLMQLADRMAGPDFPVLYISGEESLGQLKLRADRLGLRNPHLYLLNETRMAALEDRIATLRPRMVIVDSIQTVYAEEIPSPPGSVSQVREAAVRFQAMAKGMGITVFLIGHVTKAGLIAGPRLLEHIVDTVLYLEGDRYHAFRLLRSVKNRFGATSEVGVFEMRSDGMVEVPNPSELFLAERLIQASGSAVAVTMEGTRPLLVEVQALVSPAPPGAARRTANGVDPYRLLLLVAVLTKRVGLRLHDQDLFVNVVGGLRVEEPAADLAVAMAIVSSARDRPLPPDMVFIGEVGLSGELRAVGHLELRLAEAAKLGFRRCLLPRTIRRLREVPADLQVLPARTLAEALRLAFDGATG